MEFAIDHVSIILFSILITPILSNPGCQDIFDNINCIHKSVCIEYVDTRYDNVCYNNNNYGVPNKAKVYMSYKKKFLSPDENVPVMKNIEPAMTSRLITRLDMSENEYTYIPPLRSMRNLLFLNLSGNYITTAKLSNGLELLKLQEIDLSNNNINTIVTNSSYFILYKNLNKLNLSRNYLVTLPDETFERISELRYLDLSYNYIDSLNVLTFEGIKKLLFLNLSHNKITKINFAFLRFNILEELYLDHNNIDVVKVTDFEALKNLKILDLSSNALIDVQLNSFQNTYQLRIVDLSKNKIETLNKYIFLNSSKLESINLSTNKIKTLPKMLFSNKNIKLFSIKDNVLEGSLTNGTFDGLDHLVELNLSNQNLTAIEDYAFFGLEMLITLLLNNNKIHALSQKSFNGLKNLRELDLSYNKLINLEFDTDDFIGLRILSLRGNYISQVNDKIFNGLNGLHFLDISNNNISSLNSDIFISLKNLINLDLANNPLCGDLQQDSFNGMNTLPILDLSKTSLNNIRNNSLNGMVQLRKINLSHGKISVLEFNAFSNTGLIEFIDLSYNRLENFFINTTDLKNLNTLILEQNLLKMFSYNSFRNLQSLSKIIVSYNYLENIPEELFIDQKNLKYLDLSFNKGLKFNISQIRNHGNLHELYLSGVSNKIISFNNSTNMNLSHLAISNAEITNVTKIGLRRLNNLENLNLSHNNISALVVEAFHNVSNLRTLDLSFNKITFIQPGVFKSNGLLLSLNISHNFLTSISYGIFRGLNYLQTIDISYNQIDNLQSERFYEVKSLEVLIADNNKINTIYPEEFYGTSLSRLSIGGNPIPCEQLVSFKNNPIPFNLTAIKLDEHINENVDGITCNFDYDVTTMPSKNNLNKDDILHDIRDILVNWKSKSMNESEHSPMGNNDTYYLAKLLVIQTHLTDIIRNLTSERDDEQKALANLTAVLSNESRKTNAFISKFLNTNNITSPQKGETLVENKGAQSSTFTAICIALMIVTLLVFVLYKLYKYGAFESLTVVNESSSSHQMSHLMENQNL